MQRQEFTKGLLTAVLKKKKKSKVHGFLWRFVEGADDAHGEGCLVPEPVNLPLPPQLPRMHHFEDPSQKVLSLMVRA